MANYNRSLPSPKSRRSTDPSQKPNPLDVDVSVQPYGGEARITVDAFGSFEGIPQAILTGGSHAVPLLPMAAEAIAVGVIQLTYEETVEDGDVITWPERDPAVRTRAGGYIRPQSYVASGAVTPTEPQQIAIDFDAETLTLSVEFNQDIVPAGPSILGRITYADENGIIYESLSFTVAGAIASVLMRGADQTFDQTADTTTSGAVGVAIVGAVGGIAAADWTDASVTFTDTTAAPIVVWASTAAIPGTVTTYWNSALTAVNLGVAGRFEGTNAATRYNSSTQTVSGATLFGDCGNANGAAAAQWVSYVADGTVKSTASNVNNALVDARPLDVHP